MIIGIAGKMGTGKDYICNNIVIPILEKYNSKFLQMSFADQIKVNVMTKNNISFNDVYIHKNAETRTLLQTEGTELGRDILGKDIWIRYFDNWMKVYKSRGINHFILNDVRFLNEVEYIKKSGGLLIYINAPQRNYNRLYRESNGDPDIIAKLSNHISECDLDTLPYNYFDIVVHNDLHHLLQDSFQNIYNILSKRL
jgi:dephospho-CoA kinase